MKNSRNATKVAQNRQAPTEPPAHRKIAFQNPQIPRKLSLLPTKHGVFNLAIILVNLLGILLIGAIIWWFWIAKPKAKIVEGNKIEIVVDKGVYSPSRVVVKAGQPITLSFTRYDATPCAEKVVFNKLNITRDLPLNETVDIELNPEKGEYGFTCQMQMYKGSLVVE